MQVTVDHLNSDEKLSTATDGTPRHQTPPSSQAAADETSNAARSTSTSKTLLQPPPARSSTIGEPSPLSSRHAHTYLTHRTLYAAQRGPSLDLRSPASTLDASPVVDWSTTSKQATRGGSRKRGPWPTTKGAYADYRTRGETTISGITLLDNKSERCSSKGGQTYRLTIASVKGCAEISFMHPRSSVLLHERQYSKTAWAKQERQL